MDTIQVARRPGLLGTLRRRAVLLACGVAGTFIGTQALAALPSRQSVLILGIVVVVFVLLSGSRLIPAISPRWEPWLSPPVGLLSGVVGGITNVPGTPLAMYFQALGMDKTEFVRSLAIAFLLYKATQLVAVAYFGLLPLSLFGWSFGVSAIALITFWAGLAIQDRLDQGAFERSVRVFLAVVGILLIVRSV